MHTTQLHATVNACYSKCVLQKPHLLPSGACIKSRDGQEPFIKKPHLLPSGACIKSRDGQEPFIYSVYDRIFGDFPAQNYIYTPYKCGSGQP